MALHELDHFISFFDECSSDMKRMIHWDDEKNGESEIEPFEEASETDVSDDEQSNDE